MTVKTEVTIICDRCSDASDPEKFKEGDGRVVMIYDPAEEPQANRPPQPSQVLHLCGECDTAFSNFISELAD